MAEPTVDLETIEGNPNLVGGRGFGPRDHSVSVLDLLLLVLREKWRIVGAALVAALLALGISFLMAKKYTGSTKILPPQQNQSITSMVLGELGPLAGMMNNTGGDLLRDPNDMYVGMLQSRTVADALIKRFGLQQRYRKKTMEDTRKALDDATDIHSGKDGLIDIEFEDKDPQFAAQVADAYVQELMALCSRIATEDAVNRRDYYQKELEEAKSNLSDAEVALRKTQEATGLIDLDDQARAIIEAIATVRGQIAAKEVEIKAMGTFATDRNPDYLRSKEQLAGLYAQLEKLEQQPNPGRGNVMVPTGAVPAVGLEYTRRLRDVKYYETIFEILAKQYEATKFDQGNTIATVEVMDWAVTPDKKTSPKRGLMTIIGFFCGLFGAILWCLTKAANQQAMSDPQHRLRMRELHRALLGDRSFPLIWRRAGTEDLTAIRPGGEENGR